MALNARQEKFCLEYIIDGNATWAAIRAGYAEKRADSTGGRLLKLAGIRARLDALLDEIKGPKIADAAEVQAYLTACIRGEAEEEVVVVESAGPSLRTARCIRKKVSGREQMKAAELLGKMHGMFTERLDIGGNVTVVFEDDYGDG